MGKMFVRFVATTLLLASTLSVVSALQVIVTGFNLFSATYAPADTSCTGVPTSVTYIALGVCFGGTPAGSAYAIASADMAGNIYLSPYSDAACTVSLGADTKASSQKCVNGISTNQYSSVSPDATLNVQPPGALIATSISYAASDTSCAQTPTQATYVNAQQCYVGNTISVISGTTNASSTSSSQYIVDNSGNVYFQSFTGTTTCAAGTGLVTVQLQPTQKCSSTRTSSYVFGAFPAALVPQINQVLL
jgi:hypothetical protein